MSSRTTDNIITQHIEHLQRRRDNPVQGVIAATALGREAVLLRKELDQPSRVLGPGDADNTISALTLAMWDMKVPPSQRAAAAWALGEIGGLQPARKLLNRLEAVLGAGESRILGAIAQSKLDLETSGVRASLVEALDCALDAATLRALSAYDRGQLGRVCQALQQYLFNSEEKDPDLFTAVSMTLAKLALRSPKDVPQAILRTLLNTPQPTASLAVVGALTELILANQRQGVLDFLYEGRLDVELTQVLRKLGDERGQPYAVEDAQHFLQLAAQYWNMEQDTRLAGDRLWERIGSAAS